MTESLPNWIMQRYATLWAKVQSKPFSYSDAMKILKNDGKRLSVIISELKSRGWITAELDPEDARKRKYRLKNPEDAIHEIVKSKVNRT